MKKFAIEITKGDVSKVLDVFDTHEAAVEAGKAFRLQHPREEGLISCIYADFDENKNRIGNGYRLYETFM